MMSRRTSVVFWSVAIGLGIIRAWTMRYYMNPDGVSFLDMGDAFWRGDWNVATNAYWSPMYSWLTGLVLIVFKPSPYWEFASIQALNLVIFVTMLVCFGFFWRELLAWQKSRATELPGRGALAWPDSSWMLLGYSIAAWAGLRLINLETTNSDMLLAGFVYLASGLIVRIWRGLAGWSNFALLGLVLGFGFLAKSPMFPLAFVFLGVALFSTGDWKKGAPRALLALFVFALVAGPLVVALSQARGHFTFGESGRVNFQMQYEDRGWWFAEAPGDGQKELPEAPLPVEIDTLPGVTYLPFYDHTRLTPHGTSAGSTETAPHATARVRLGRYLKTWLRNVHVYYDVFVLRQGPLLASILILFLLGPSWKANFRNILQNWHVLLPAFTALGAYGLLIVEMRYVGPFIPVFWGGILAALQLQDMKEFKRIPNIIAIVVATLFAVQLIGFVGQDVVNNPTGGHTHWEVAQGLHEFGLQPGDKVGVMGRAQRSYWARLGRFSIAAQISLRGTKTFWAASPESRKRSLEALARTGVKAVVLQMEPQQVGVAENWPHVAAAEGWRQLGNTDKYAYLFSP